MSKPRTLVEDQEVIVMAKCLKLLRTLPPDAQARAMEWLSAKVPERVTEPNDAPR